MFKPVETLMEAGDGDKLKYIQLCCCSLNFWCSGVSAADTALFW